MIPLRGARYCTAVALLVGGAGVCLGAIGEGSKLPPITVVDAAGKPLALAEIQDKADFVVVTLISGKCTSCEGAWNTMQTWEEQYRDRPIVFIVVDVDGPPGADVRPARNLPQPIYYATSGENGIVARLGVKPWDLPLRLTVQHGVITYVGAIGLDDAEMRSLDPDDFAARELQYQRKVQANPKDHDAHHSLGKLYEAQGFTRMAVVEYCEALRLGPAREETHYRNHCSSNLEKLIREMEDYRYYAGIVGLPDGPDLIRGVFDRALEALRKNSAGK